MSVELTEKYYEKMQKAYMDCIKDAVATALFEAWGENWYKLLQEKDIELTDETNRIRKESAEKKGKNFIPVPYITDKFDSIIRFDFQGLNKLFYYMDEVRGIVYKEFGKADIFEDKTEDKKYKKYFESLISFRNTFEGHKARENEMPTEKELEIQSEAISKMRTILKDVFCDVINVKDTAKRTYFLSFEDYRTAYERELLKKPYLLDKYIDCSRFDTEKFYEACQDLGIEGKKIEGKDVFYSANLDDDLEKLKNALSVSSAPQSPKPEVHNEEKKQTVPYKTIAVVAVAAVLCIVVAFLLGKALSDEDNSSSASKPNDSVTQSSNEQINNVSSSAPVVTSSNEESSSQAVTNVSKNELDDDYNQDVEEFKYLDKAQKNLRTLKIKVGEKITPQAAAVWGDCEIFSQNTDIAKAQGIIVEGISKGETYIVVEASTGMSQVFMVVVG
jgi:hypothetical protein